VTPQTLPIAMPVCRGKSRASLTAILFLTTVATLIQLHRQTTAGFIERRGTTTRARKQLHFGLTTTPLLARKAGAESHADDGGVVGRTTDIAPGCEASLTYRQVKLSVSNESVFDTSHKSGDFYYNVPEISYSPGVGLGSA
jgi:hypothetical protein